ncbi:MAG: DNA polymerase III subunit delta' [Desulfobacteraceae bacterium]|nr:DNA polymerase III subunit delta' [Desulfobacteraceae bacterium]
MLGFKSIIGQAFPKRLLHAYLKTGAIPHALMFTGMEGIGKCMTAKAFAMALKCIQNIEKTKRAGSVPGPQHDACGQCRTCRQIQADTHPDVLTIEPIGAFLRIDQVRRMLSALALKPFQPGHRAVIITKAHMMNKEAANALLKILEEPPDNTVLILTALQKSDLLPTISSRCRQIRFSPLSHTELFNLLIKQENIDPDQANLLAGLSGGSLTKALDLHRSGWQQQRDWLIRSAGLVAPQQLNNRPLALTLTFAGQLANQKDLAPGRLEILSTWIRDMSIVRLDSNKVTNRDCIGQLESASGQLSGRQICRLWDVVVKAQKDIAANANLRLTLDVMALKMVSAVSSRQMPTTPA